MPLDGLYMMSAKSLTTLKRNCLLLLQELVGEDNFTFSIASKEGYLFDHKILLEGANDIRSESKIRGLTLQGAYCDELTQFPEDFFTMLLSRLRMSGAKLFATTNPDSPSHWLKVNYIDRAKELNFLDVKFLIDDNTTLPKDYVEDIKREYTGVFYDRFILGNWVLAEGIIYPMYKEAIESPPENYDRQGNLIPPERYCLSLDYGTMNAFSAGLWAKYGDVWYRVKEYYYSGRDTGVQKTDEEYAVALDKLIEPIMLKRKEKQGRYFEKMEVIIDPSAASFITLLRKKEWYKVTPADNAVLDGIRDTASSMQLGKIKISPECKNWIKEAQGYVWDADEAEDKPVKVNDHAMDDTRYFVKTKRIAVHKANYIPIYFR